VLEEEHLYTSLCGVERAGAHTPTSALRRCAMTRETREKFLALAMILALTVT
jgi:hypothetical protein